MPVQAGPSLVYASLPSFARDFSDSANYASNNSQQNPEDRSLFTQSLGPAQENSFAPTTEHPISFDHRESVSSYIAELFSRIALCASTAISEVDQNTRNHRKNGHVFRCTSFRLGSSTSNDSFFYSTSFTRKTSPQPQKSVSKDAMPNITTSNFYSIGSRSHKSELFSPSIARSQACKDRSSKTRKSHNPHSRIGSNHIRS
ncbi:hypothetical protein TCE0_034r10417 [Talaromyces pinophilus]|uniref:Uncharacterized protein n=1 Tax=Talaromyces pinophilus TaxID=128442 RepID=A0A6V8HDE7_TALPI|nr:hypothetical protein TCE0_034r10417 [Talaromyces pinophilus]